MSYLPVEFYMLRNNEEPSGVQEYRYWNDYKLKQN